MLPGPASEPGGPRVRVALSYTLPAYDHAWELPEAPGEDLPEAPGGLPAVPSTTTASGVRVALSYTVAPNDAAWELPEVPVPESRFHDLTLAYLCALLEAWVARSARQALVARNLAVRWDRSQPKMGVDPDLCLIEPVPPENDRLQSLRLWEPGHTAPQLAIEVVSRSHPYKDYHKVQDKYAVLGVAELWVLDPEGIGPSPLGDPIGVQAWRHGSAGFEREYAGEGPAWSAVLEAWVAVTPECRVRLSDNRDGTLPWLTSSEAERAAKEAEQAAKETERAAKEAALRRVAELETEIAKLRAPKGS